MAFIMRYSESHSGNRYGVTVFNYVAGVLISCLFLKKETMFLITTDGTFTIAMAVVNAFLFLACILLIQNSIKKDGVALEATFNRLGILIPTVLSIFLFAEIPSFIQCIGLGLAVYAIVYINKDVNSKEKKSISPSLIAVFVVGGCVDMNSKVFSYFGNTENQELFIFYTFLFALIMSIFVCIKKNRNISKQDVLIGFLVGIPNQLTALCLVKAVALVPAYVVFPLYSGGIILTINVVSIIIFREKLNKNQYIGMGIIAIALALINLGN